MKHLYLPRFSIHAKSLLISGLMMFLWIFSFPAQADTLQATKDIAWSQDKRFSDNGDQTITDHKTGLMWMKIDAFQRQGHLLNWNESLAFIDNLNKEGFAGFADWRVPTRKELITLYEADKLNNSTDMTIHIDPIFPKNGLASHWSSETNGQYNAFGVVFNTGEVFNASRLAQSNNNVSAVRNDQ
jgi:hypothetical protein